MKKSRCFLYEKKKFSLSSGSLRTSIDTGHTNYSDTINKRLTIIIIDILVLWLFLMDINIYIYMSNIQSSEDVQNFKLLRLFDMLLTSLSFAVFFCLSRFLLIDNFPFVTLSAASLYFCNSGSFFTNLRPPLSNS